MCRWLTNIFDVKTITLLLKDGKPISITLKDVENLIGLQMAGRELKPIGSNQTSKLFYKLKDKNKKREHLHFLLEK